MPAAPPSAASLRRLARRLETAAPADWCAPPLPELIEAIDAALRRRRASTGG